MFKLSILTAALALLVGCKGCSDDNSADEDSLSGARDYVEPLERDDRPSWAARERADSEIQDEPDNPMDVPQPVEEAPVQPAQRAWADEPAADEQIEPPTRYVPDEADDAIEEEVDEQPPPEDDQETPTDLAEEDDEEPTEPTEDPYEDY